KWTDGVRERLKGSGQRASILNVSVPTQWKSRFTSTLVAVLLVTIIIWNGAALGYVNLPQDDIPVSPTDRTWDMFAEPRNIDGWYVVPGKLKSGGEIDAFYRSPVDWDRPPDIAQKFPNQRWLVYLVDLTREEYSELRPYFAQYLCRRWNSEHGDQDKLTEVTVYYMKQPTRLNGPEPIQRENLGTYSCFS
ncbi:MAG: HTTM domain-containing protein, partial [Halobacteria archaeon]|nr:HTTM domain-containing protein [Halobacteria archaeon]